MHFRNKVPFSVCTGWVATANYRYRTTATSLFWNEKRLHPPIWAHCGDPGQTGREGEETTWPEGWNSFCVWNPKVTRGGCMMKYLLSPRDFLRAQAIFHHIRRLLSQFSHSRLPLNIFFCLGPPFERRPNIFLGACIASLSTLFWQLQKFNRKYTLYGREYCNRYIFQYSIVFEKEWYKLFEIYRLRFHENPPFDPPKFLLKLKGIIGTAIFPYINI